MTENVICARCQCTFERVRVEEDGALEVQAKTQTYIQEPEPVCDDCEHEFLAWVGCPPLC